MGDYTHRLSLAAYHNDADLSALPAEIGLVADKVARVGDMRIAPNGRVTGGRYRFSTCGFKFEPKDGESLPTHLAAVMAQLKPYRAAFERWSGAGVRFEFFVGWFSDFNSRDIFDWTLLADIAALRISLDIDFYGPDAPEA
jgi:hypothetical protein